MPLPVAHALIGASLNNSFRESSRTLSFKVVALSVLLAICPDFDYVLNFLKVGHGGWHHGFTHSIVFAVVVGTICWLVLRDRRPRTLLLLCAIVMSHTLLDYLFTESRGVALFWPITDHRYKLDWINPINYSWRTTSFLGAATDLARLTALEIIVFGPILLLSVLIRRRLSA